MTHIKICKKKKKKKKKEKKKMGRMQICNLQYCHIKSLNETETSFCCCWGFLRFFVVVVVVVVCFFYCFFFFFLLFFFFFFFFCFFVFFCVCSLFPPYIYYILIETDLSHIQNKCRKVALKMLLAKIRGKHL